ncbi:tripartite tricarboxylate transporter TctB family protein [Thalassobacillus sp. CUG 92003]|uniref:tripartite tricarboxylate transporter TctB family protein n=1 Tax=Thalassobacillus sp. CUG 92003 TaxID=2736641 RepID=UPI0015E6A223|nr:tripartite tricarboxylate transporter TctB family protein [Thalassobacillus sp. CUG 92003]
MRRNLYAFAISIFLISLFFLVQTIQLPGSSEVSTLIGPRFWPLILVVSLIFLSLSLLIGTFISNKREENNISEEAKPDQLIDRYGAEGSKSNAYDQRFITKHRHWILLVVTILYTFLMNIIGYLFATIIFIAICSIVLGMGKKIHVLITLVSGVVLIVVVFDQLLNIPLP